MQTLRTVVVEGKEFSAHFVYGAETPENGMLVRFEDLERLEDPEYRRQIRYAAVEIMAQLLPENYKAAFQGGRRP